MKISSIPYAQTGYFSSLVHQFLNNDKKLSPFINEPFTHQGIENALKERAAKKLDRTVLHQVLSEQHKNYSKEHNRVAENIELLKLENTFTITTGHQICLASGPLYFIYKLASAINLCQQLAAKYPQYNFVPIYWMATEDHDFEEINHIHLFNKKVEWLSSESGATGKISTTGIESFFTEIEQLLGEKAAVLPFYKQFKLNYTQHATLAEATRAMVMGLFGSYGLLTIDADNAELKHLFKSIIVDDITQQHSFNLVEQTSVKMTEQLGIPADKIQVKPRPINFFYLENQSRKRIVKEHNKYQVLNTEITFTEEALKAEINQHPERFSPNVIMRPVYQECILPNLAYIGGGGELAYWFELKEVFDYYKVFYPILILRNSFLWMDKKQVKQLHQFNLEVADVFKPLEQLIEKIMQHLGVEVIDLEKQVTELNAVYEQIKKLATTIDSTLVASADAAKTKAKKGIEHLTAKLNKAQKAKHEVAINQIKRIKENLFPHNGLQERYDNILWLQSKFGNDVIDELVKAANPFEGFQILEEE